jgi:hypothetical protein
LPAFTGVPGVFWPPLIGTVAASAVAAQTLLIAFGLAIPARADADTPTFELRLRVPAGDPGVAACGHCIFCFAGSHHAAIRPPPAGFERVDAAIAAAFPAAGRPPGPRLAAHSIA